MALSPYSADGPINATPLTQYVERVTYTLSDGSAPTLPQNNLLNRLLYLRKFEMVVQVQGVPSSGNKVTFFDSLGRKVSSAVSDVNGYVKGVCVNEVTLTAIVEDKPGGDAYNSLIRTGLVTVPFEVS